MTGIMSRLLQRSLQHQFKVNASSAAITSKLVHYAVLLLVVLFVMRTVNIPLTAFTFLGGAIAIPLTSVLTFVVFIWFMFALNPLLALLSIGIYPVELFAIPYLQKKLPNKKRNFSW